MERLCQVMWDQAVLGTETWADRTEEQREAYRRRIRKALAEAQHSASREVPTNG